MERLPQGTRRLAAELKSPLPVQLLWDVLTDYENLSRFIPNLSTSDLIQRQGQTVRLQQVGSQQLLFFWRVVWQVPGCWQQERWNALRPHHSQKRSWRPWPPIV